MSGASKSPPHAHAQTGQSHKEKLQNQTEEEQDVYETLITKSECAKFHFALQDCYFEHNDWRKCKREMEDFKMCVNAQKSSKT